jgi:hypothetical protein
MVTHAKLAALITSACGVAACSSEQPYQQLPDVARLPETLLSKDEQQARIVDGKAASQGDASAEGDRGDKVDENSFSMQQMPPYILRQLYVQNSRALPVTIFPAQLGAAERPSAP